MQGQDYKVDASTLSNQTLSIFAEWLKCVWSSVITVKNHTLSFDRFRPFFLCFLLEVHRLLALEIQIDGYGRRFYVETRMGIERGTRIRIDSEIEIEIVLWFEIRFYVETRMGMEIGTEIGPERETQIIL
ncbi:hypothetical protein EVAR_9901_1 [Eumeta japonica]|uniref:Uncharacterized protein n=1 Tax=Eumeta variegata TaxID=151549 RepID=A0A4C1TQE1_EUMVA|nr:hypothetical protein EVAR_9901_1 [Eumeta japonica]